MFITRMQVSPILSIYYTGNLLTLYKKRAVQRRKMIKNENSIHCRYNKIFDQLEELDWLFDDIIMSSVNNKFSKNIEDLKARRDRSNKIMSPTASPGISRLLLSSGKKKDNKEKQTKHSGLNLISIKNDDHENEAQNNYEMHAEDLEKDSVEKIMENKAEAYLGKRSKNGFNLSLANISKPTKYIASNVNESDLEDDVLDSEVSGVKMDVSKEASKQADSRKMTSDKLHSRPSQGYLLNVNKEIPDTNKDSFKKKKVVNLKSLPFQNSDSDLTLVNQSSFINNVNEDMIFIFPSPSRQTSNIPEHDIKYRESCEVVNKIPNNNKLTLKELDADCEVKNLESCQLINEIPIPDSENVKIQESDSVEDIEVSCYKSKKSSEIQVNQEAYELEVNKQGAYSDHIQIAEINSNFEMIDEIESPYKDNTILNNRAVTEPQRANSQCLGHESPQERNSKRLSVQNLETMEVQPLMRYNSNISGNQDIMHEDSDAMTNNISNNYDNQEDDCISV